MPHSPITTLATMNHASNITILAIFVSIANGTSARFAKSTAPATLNGVALLVALVPVPLRHCRPLPPNLVPFLHHGLDEWSRRILVFTDATLAPIPLLTLVLL